MTTFEITIIILAVLGMLMMGWLVKVCKDVFEALQVANIRISDIKSDTNYLINLGYHLPKLVDIVDKIHRNLCVEIADKMVDKVCDILNHYCNRTGVHPSRRVDIINHIRKEM